jgi:signal transduction histidine kinase
MRMRITVAAVVVTGVAIGAAGWVLVRSVENAQIRELHSDISDSLDQVAASLGEGKSAQQAVEAATPGALDFLEVTDEEGMIVAFAPSFIAAGKTYGSPLPDPARQSVSRAAPQPALIVRSERLPTGAGATASAGAESGGVSAELGTGERFLSIAGLYSGPAEILTRTVETPSGTLTVTAAAPADQLAGTLDSLRQALMIGLPVVIVLVAALVWVLVGWALRPVNAICAEVDEITGSTIHRRVPEPTATDEISRLARTMNAMLIRLDSSATRQRQFVSDASHELRSPVASIRTGLEVARRKGVKANWLAVADAALAEEARLEALIDDLLLLAAQDESGSSPRGPGVVNLTAIADVEAQRHRRLAVEVVDPAPAARPVLVAGAADQLTRVVANLLDNAARHATAAVQLRVTACEGTARVMVDDDGPGVAAEDRERIFDRFTRLDGSRARSAGGTGLGLAVARSIVTTHDGRVWVTTSPLGGARFAVELPLAELPVS